MKLYSALSLIGFGVGVAAFAAAGGCGSSGGDTGTTAATKGRQPAAKPDAPAAAIADARTFAVNSLQLGEGDRAGAANKDAWKDYGFDLDGTATTKDSKDVCTRLNGASSSNQEDGKEGIDNAFGKVIIPFLQPFAATPSKTLTDSIVKGDFTIMLSIKGLTDDAAQTNTGLSGELLVGGKFGEGKSPTFTQADDWPYRADPRIPISEGYVNKGTFVNGAGGATVTISLFIQGISLDLTINKAIITFDHKPPNDIVNGTIAGVIGTEKLISGLEKVAGRISSQLCSGSTLDSIKATIRQASDILQDGSNKAGVNCDAISVGIGFTAKRIANPTQVFKDDGTTPPDPCKGDGGT